MSAPDVMGKPFLTIPEVAEIIGRTRHCAARWLSSNGVEFRRAGRRRLVATSEIERVFPEIARALELARIAKAIECPGCGGPMRCASRCGFEAGRRSAG